MDVRDSINDYSETTNIAAERTDGPYSMMRSFGSIFGSNNSSHRRPNNQNGADGYVEFGMQNRDDSGRTLGTFAGVFSPVALSMFSALVFIRVDPPRFDDTGLKYFHFNEIQLNILQEACKNSNTKYVSNLSNKSKYKATSKECFELPWQNSISKGNLKLLQKLPPSLQPLKLKRLSKIDLKINKWS